MKKTSNNSPDAGGRVSVSPAVGANYPAVTPQFIRLPRAGTHCPWSGLTRGKMNDLILNRTGKKPPVESVSLRQRGQVRGTRLIVLKSLLGYLDRLRQEQTP